MQLSEVSTRILIQALQYRLYDQLYMPDSMTDIELAKWDKKSLRSIHKMIKNVHTKKPRGYINVSN